MIGFAAKRLMELEVGALTGAGYGEKTLECLVSATATATGPGRPERTVELRIPKLRKGNYLLGFLEPPWPGLRYADPLAPPRSIAWRKTPSVRSSQNSYNHCNAGTSKSVLERGGDYLSR